jgi:hypothetical protein
MSQEILQEILQDNDDITQKTPGRFGMICWYDHDQEEVFLRAGKGAAWTAVGLLAVLMIGSIAFVRAVFRGPGEFAAAEHHVAGSEPYLVTETVVANVHTPGLHYVVLGSHPTESAAIAQCDALIEKGIECAVEKDLPGWSKKSGWYSVVGLQGFNTIRNSPNYDGYVAKIRSLGHQPRPYKWRGDPLITEVASLN